MAYYPAMIPDEMRDLTRRVRAYIDGIETTVIKIAAEHETVSIKTLWEEFLKRHNKLSEFRSLSTVATHAEDLVERRVFAQVDAHTYKLV